MLSRQGCRLDKVLFCLVILAQLTKRGRLGESSAGKYFSGCVWRGFGLQKLKSLGRASFARAGFRSQDTKFPVQIWIRRGLFVTHFRELQGLVSKALLKLKAGLSILLIQ